MTVRTRVRVPKRDQRPLSAQARVRQWGSSCGLIIPKAIRQQLGIDDGTELTLELEDERIIITRSRGRRRPRRPLKQIIPHLTPRKPLEGWDDAAPVGEEIL